MKLSAIDTNLLLALHALLQEKNVTRAAKRLGTGQPAMSRSLARLRDHFKDPLLVSRGREFVLSATAQALVGSVEKAAAALADVFEERGSRERASRVFVLACADLFATAVVPRALSELTREAPLAGLEVRSIPARSSEQILSDGVDVALGVFEDVPATVNQRHLFTDSFVCVVRADHPRVRSTLSLQTYLSLDHLEVLPAPNARPGLRIERALGAKAPQRRVAASVPYFSVAARILARSDLALTMTRSWAQVLQEFAPLRVVDVPMKIPPQRFSLVWHRRLDNEPIHTRFREMLANVCIERFGNAL